MTSPLKSLLLFAALAGIGTASPSPNIVIVFIDDMGYADIGSFGATKQKTPNIDRMAAEGMKLTSFYGAPLCSVSRAQLMTGCYGARVDVPAVYPPAASHGLAPSEHTVAERLKERGYATMCIGKWHLGDQPKFLPTRQGFDHYFGIPYSNDMQRKSSATGERVVPLLRDDKVAELLTDVAQHKITERYTDEAVDFIRGHKNEPFLLYLAHTAVHLPMAAGVAFQGKSENGAFGDWVQELDWSTGRILDTLRELKLADNTFVIFTSDNGPWLGRDKNVGSAGPLRGAKGSTWEGGMRVPTIAWWPGKIKAGSVSDAVAGEIDVMPTVVSLAGGTLPEKPVIDGRDLTPLLFGESTESPRDAHYYFLGFQLQAVRQGPWKLAVKPQVEGISIKEVPEDARGNTPRLYNLDADIGERADMAGDHPEIVARLKALAERMRAEIGGNAPPARRRAGTVKKPVLLYPSDEANPSRPAKKGTETD